MKLVCRLYIAAGIIWGVILGILSGLYTTAGLVGVFWIYIFGDNAWPDWASGIVYTIGIITGILIFGICIFFSSSYCQRLSAKEVDHVREIRKAASLLALSIIVTFGYIVLDKYQADKYAATAKIRVEKEKRRMVNASPYRKVGENDVDYYCRVVQKQSKLEMIYKGQTLKLTPEAILINGQLLFAVAGSYGLIKELSKELVISEEVVAGNKILASEFYVLPESVRCGKKLFFIRSNHSPIQHSAKEMERVNVSIPSVKAGFTMAIRSEG